MIVLAERIERRRHYPSAERQQEMGEPFLIDAHAQGDDVGVGGWKPMANSKGDLDTSRSPWFAVRLTRETAPWAFHRGQAFWTIASLEALAALVAVMVLGDAGKMDPNALLMIPGITDIRGNKFALTHLQTNKYPLIIILMELSCQLESRGQRLHLQWTPRELNEEADRPAAGDTTGFNDELRIPFDPSNQKWMV